MSSIVPLGYTEIYPIPNFKTSKKQIVPSKPVPSLFSKYSHPSPSMFPACTLSHLHAYRPSLVHSIHITTATHLEYSPAQAFQMETDCGSPMPLRV